MPDFSIQDNIAELTTDHEMVDSEFAFVSEHGFDHRPFVAMLHIMPRIRDAIFEAFIGDLDKVYDTYNRGDSHSGNVLRNNAGFIYSYLARWSNRGLAVVIGVNASEPGSIPMSIKLATVVSIEVGQTIVYSAFFGKVGTRQLISEQFHEAGCKRILRKVCVGFVRAQILGYPYFAKIGQATAENHPRVARAIEQTYEALEPSLERVSCLTRNIQEHTSCYLYALLHLGHI